MSQEINHENFHKLSKEVIEQIKYFPNYYSFPDSMTVSVNPDLTPIQRWTIDALIPNKLLNLRYKNYGLCRECWQPNTGGNRYKEKNMWCQPCNAKHFQEVFSNWTSGNLEIDKFLQESQLTANHSSKVLEWIPYTKLVNIKGLAEGSFGKVYKADWTDGYIERWNVKDNKWERSKDYLDSVVLKSLKRPQNVIIKILREITNHMLFNTQRIVECLGISRDPKNKNYMIVMPYAGENLRSYLSNNQLDFKEKFNLLADITSGLNSIHNLDLVHKDFHPGNILIKKHEDGHDYSYITDLGLCRKVNELDDEKSYGILPYVAPEVLRREAYTQVADIYSWSIVAYELFSGLSPYDGRTDYWSLKPEIMNKELRPNLNNIQAPQLLKDLIKRCWKNDPKLRPTSGELEKIILNWLAEIGGLWELYEEKIDENSEFYKQYKEIEKNKIINSAPRHSEKHDDNFT